MENKNWKTKSLLYGAGIGMICGLIITYIRIQRAESNNETLSLNKKDTAKIGLAVIEILRKMI